MILDKMATIENINDTLIGYIAANNELTQLADTTHTVNLDGMPRNSPMFDATEKRFLEIIAKRDEIRQQIQPINAALDKLKEHNHDQYTWLMTLLDNKFVGVGIDNVLDAVCTFVEIYDKSYLALIPESYEEFLELKVKK